MSETEPKVEFYAKLICLGVSLPSTDPYDGSPNWWMFCEDARKMIADLESRGFTFHIERRPNGKFGMGKEGKDEKETP